MNELERKYHEVANLFPLMQGDEFEELKADIKQNGLLEPIWIHPDGSIIDGRNRHRACIETGVQPKFRTWSGGGSLVSFVVSLNLKRRHLNSSQSAVISQNVLPLLEQEAKERMKWTPTNTSVEIIPPSEKGKTRDKAAELFNTNPRYVSDAKKLAEKSPESIERIMAGESTIPQEMRKIRREEKLETISQNNKPLNDRGKKYSVVYADPPWRYEHPISDSRKIENQYPTMTDEEICSLPINDIVSDDAVLFLWVTVPMLERGIKVMNAWGFSYRTSMVWVKPSIGPGHWVRNRHELLFIGRKGNMPTPDPSNKPDSVLEAPREEHSKKPEIMYSIIENMYPNMQRIELFARNKREGWDAWGNQA